MKSWILALRPKTLSAAVVPIVVATALVYAEGKAVVWWVSVLALVASVFIQIATNFINDAIDFKKGADTEDRLGPQRVTQSGLLSYRAVMVAGILCLVVAALFGIPLVLKGGLPIVLIGLVSLFCAYSYTGGPFPLAYLGLGELFVMIFFGLIAVGGVYYLHTESLSAGAIVAGAQVGALATVLIVINNLRDREQDLLVDKKTLPVRFGHRFGIFEVIFLNMVCFFLLCFWIWNKYWLAGLLPMVALPLTLSIQKGLSTTAPSDKYNDFLAKAAGAHILFGFQLSLGFILGKIFL